MLLTTDVINQAIVQVNSLLQDAELVPYKPPEKAPHTLVPTINNLMPFVLLHGSSTTRLAQNEEDHPLGSDVDCYVFWYDAKTLKLASEKELSPIFSKLLSYCGQKKGITLLDIRSSIGLLQLKTSIKVGTSSIELDLTFPIPEKAVLQPVTNEGALLVDANDVFLETSVAKNFYQTNDSSAITKHYAVIPRQQLSLVSKSESIPENFGKGKTATGAVVISKIQKRKLEIFEEDHLTRVNYKRFGHLLKKVIIAEQRRKTVSEDCKQLIESIRNNEPLIFIQACLFCLQSAYKTDEHSQAILYGFNKKHILVKNQSFHDQFITAIKNFLDITSNCVINFPIQANVQFDSPKALQTKYLATIINTIHQSVSLKECKGRLAVIYGEFQIPIPELRPTYAQKASIKPIESRKKTKISLPDNTRRETPATLHKAVIPTPDKDKVTPPTSPPLPEKKSSPIAKKCDADSSPTLYDATSKPTSGETQPSINESEDGSESEQSSDNSSQASNSLSTTPVVNTSADISTDSRDDGRSNTDRTRKVNNSFRPRVKHGHRKKSGKPSDDEDELLKPICQQKTDNSSNNYLRPILIILAFLLTIPHKAIISLKIPKQKKTKRQPGKGAMLRVRKQSTTSKTPTVQHQEKTAPSKFMQIIYIFIYACKQPNMQAIPLLFTWLRNIIMAFQLRTSFLDAPTFDNSYQTMLYGTLATLAMKVPANLIKVANFADNLEDKSNYCEELKETLLKTNIEHGQTNKEYMGMYRVPSSLMLIELSTGFFSHSLMQLNLIEDKETLKALCIVGITFILGCQIIEITTNYPTAETNQASGESATPPKTAHQLRK